VWILVIGHLFGHGRKSEYFTFRGLCPPAYSYGLFCGVLDNEMNDQEYQPKMIPMKSWQEKALREMLARQIENTCIILRRNPKGFCTCNAHTYAKLVRG